MTSEPSERAGTAPWYRRRRTVAAALGLVLIGAGLTLWCFRPRPPAPMPPWLDLEGVDPEVQQAIESARQQVLQHPSAHSWGLLGMVLRAHDCGAEANRCFAEAERLDPREPRWPYLCGLTLMQTDPEAGIRCLERAAQRCGEVPNAPRLRLAEALLEQGRLDEAQHYLEEVRRQEPNNCRARLGLGRLALLRGQWQTALEQLEPCTDDIHARKRAHAFLAETCGRLGDVERARAEQRRAAEAPDDVLWPDPFVQEVLQLQRGLRFRLQEAAALFQRRQFDEAIRLLEETVARYPESTQARLHLGDTWRILERPDRAEQVLREAVQIDPGAAEAWFRLGCVQALNRSPEAEDSFRRAIDLKPDHTLAHFNLAHRLSERGDASGAAEELRAALRSRPDYTPARDALRALAEKGARTPPTAKP
jgi:tetratricopeptide (TPR) repeat protein